MVSLFPRRSLLATGLLAALGATGVAWADPPASEPAGKATVSAAVDFARDVQPLLAKHCYECHGAKKQESGLRLDQRAGAMAGGELGRDIVPHKSGDSRLVAALRGASEVISRMPPERDPLSPEQIALVERWIDEGAQWPDEHAGNAGKDSANHWAFRAGASAGAGNQGHRVAG